MNTKSEAARIIHRSSALSAAVAGVLAQGAVFGVDTLFLTPITFRMIVRIGALFGAKITQLKPTREMGAVLGVSLGAGLARDVFGFCPGLGNVANAAITLGVTESIGWSAYRIFEGGGNPFSMATNPASALKEPASESRSPEEPSEPASPTRKPGRRRESARPPGPRTRRRSRVPTAETSRPGPEKRRRTRRGSSG